MKKNICIHCQKEFIPNPRVKNQRYCNNKVCQRVRKTKWQSKKMGGDPDYRDNQKRAQREWQKQHPGYYKAYRESHPEYTERNRLLQNIRNTQRCKDGRVNLIAKMDTLIKPFYSRKGAYFKLISQNPLIAKMDTLLVKLIPLEGVMKTYIRI